MKIKIRTVPTICVFLYFLVHFYTILSQCDDVTYQRTSEAVSVQFTTGNHKLISFMCFFCLFSGTEKQLILTTLTYANIVSVTFHIQMMVHNQRRLDKIAAMIVKWQLMCQWIAYVGHCHFTLSNLRLFFFGKEKECVVFGFVEFQFSMRKFLISFDLLV